MWKIWRPIFEWETLCPVLIADPLGIIVVMPRASQPVTHSEVDAMPDHYPDTTSETKVEDHGRIGDAVVSVDYGLPDREMVKSRRAYYRQKAGEKGK